MASFGLAPYRLVAANTTNAAVVKAGPGVLKGWVIQNVAAAVRYVKLYNVASGLSVGTTVPFLTIPFAASSVSIVMFDTDVLAFSAGISVATTNLVADSDTTAVSAGDLVINLFYA